MRPDMTCAQCRELIPRYHAQQLSRTEQDAIAHHIAGCAECRGELAFWSAVGDSLAASDADQPLPVNQARVWGNVRAALAREGPRQILQHSEGGRRMTTQTPTKPVSRVTGIPPVPSRRRPIAAAFAFALIVVLSVALFGVVAPRLRHNALSGNSPQPTATPAACAPSQLRQSLPANAELSGISMVSARDGWAVGQVWDPLHPATAPQALMLRFQNCEWRQVGLSASPVQLTDVAMVSPTEGWAVGVTVKAESISPMWVGAHALLLHYHDGAWQSATIPGTPDAIGVRIHMASPTDGWMLVDEGKSHTTPYIVAYSYVLYHYDGTVWNAQPMPFKTPSMDLGNLAAGPDDLWITGYDLSLPGSGIIARYHAGQWNTWSSSVAGTTLNAPYAVGLSSPQNVWVFGALSPHNVSDQYGGDVALHYDGTSWSSVAITGARSVPVTASVLPSGDAWGLGAVSPAPPFTMTVIHCTVTGCRATSFMPPGVDGVRELAMVSATQGFAVGDHMVYGPVVGVPQSTLLYFDNGQWSVIPSAG